VLKTDSPSFLKKKEKSVVFTINAVLKVTFLQTITNDYEGEPPLSHGINPATL
jgi:hypothetical protein